MAQNRVKPPTILLLKLQINLIWLWNATFCSPNQDQCVSQSCTIATHNTGSPPYCCHSLNTYNICLCGTTVFIQWINETMATFHSVARLLAQWNALLCFQSTLNELVAKPPADLHAPCEAELSWAVLSRCRRLQTVQHVHTWSNNREREEKLMKPAHPQKGANSWRFCTGLVDRYFPRFVPVKGSVEGEKRAVTHDVVGRKRCGILSLWGFL